MFLLSQLTYQNVILLILRYLIKKFDYEIS